MYVVFDFSTSDFKLQAAHDMMKKYAEVFLSIQKYNHVCISVQK